MGRDGRLGEITGVWRVKPGVTAKNALLYKQGNISRLPHDPTKADTTRFCYYDIESLICIMLTGPLRFSTQKIDSLWTSTPNPKRVTGRDVSLFPGSVAPTPYPDVVAD